jgi:hypothetical protein
MEHLGTVVEVSGSALEERLDPLAAARLRRWIAGTVIVREPLGTRQRTWKATAARVDHKPTTTSNTWVLGLAWSWVLGTEQGAIAIARAVVFFLGPAGLCGR